MKRILKDGKNLYMKLGKRNPGKEEIKLTSAFSTNFHSLEVRTMCFIFLSLMVLCTGPWIKEF